MSRNQVQFQKGLSLPEFLKDYGAEQQCYDALFEWRWKGGFHCPKCGHNKYCDLKTNQLLQCHHCHHQTSLTAGTIFASTKLPLTTWFLGIYLMTQTKKGISAMQLHRQLGISYNAAWRMKHKLMQVMMERDDTHPLSGFVEVDDAYLGGERAGGKRGRGAADKTPFIAAVETTNDGKPIRIKLSVLTGFLKSEIRSWSQQHLECKSVVTSDGLNCFNAFSDEGYLHQKIICGGGRASVEKQELYWVNTVLGNLKSSLRSTYHAIRPQYAQRYLSEFQYRFNRRFDLRQMIPRLAFVALRTPPMPERLLKVSLV
jgi:transposase-like protein